MNRKDTTNTWLKNNGISYNQFTDWSLDIDLLQAQKIAHNLLKQHGKLLGQNEAATLNNFIRAMSSKQKRSKLTKVNCYKVMNIGTAINRKLFKQYRTLGK